MKSIIVRKVVHKGNDRIALIFPYDRMLIEISRQLSGSQWSRTMNCWHIPDSSESVSELRKAFQGKASVKYLIQEPDPGEKEEVPDEAKATKNPCAISKSSTVNLLPQLSLKGREDIERDREWMEANRYPQSTIHTYVSMMEKFLKFCESERS
jgi:hypothetical protein